MNRKIRALTAGATSVALAQLCAGQTLAADAPAFEDTPLQLNSALIVPDELMAGPGYKVDTVATSDGFNNTYLVETSFGNLEATSDYQLARTIQEIQALLALDEMSRAGVFGDTMKDGAIGIYEGTKAFVAAPVESTKGAVKGVGRWMGNVGRAARSSDPYQENAISAAVGWAGVRRAFALELGVDPYTDWEPLQDSLTTVAQAAFAGGITVGALSDAAVGGTTFGTVIEITGLSAEMNAMLIDNPPEMLTKINTDKLTGIGVPEAAIRPLMLNYNYTPLEKSFLVEALVQMDGANGRDLYVGQAAAAPDRIVARFMQQRAQIMANYHNDVARVDLVDVDGLIWMKTSAGALIGAFPIDYLAWTDETHRAVQAAADTDAKSREILLEGSASPTARQALTDAGWNVTDRAALLTGDPLQDATAAGAGLGITSTAIGTISR